MKAVSSTRLLREAATILEPIRDDVVVIGALAVQVALDSHDVVLAPTADVDAGVSVKKVDQIVAHLESKGMRGSNLPHERGFRNRGGRPRRPSPGPRKTCCVSFESVRPERSRRRLRPLYSVFCRLPA